MRVVGEAASLVGAQVALAALETQGELLARAELRALRAQISPHFVYNALTAVASSIHYEPRRGPRASDRVLRVHPLRVRARAPVRDAGRRAPVRREVPAPGAGSLRRAPAGAGRGRARGAADGVPVLSVQPLVENAIRHGVEARYRGRAWRSSASDFDARRGAARGRRRRGDAARAGRGRPRGRARTASGSRTSTAACRRRSATSTASRSSRAPGGGPRDRHDRCPSSARGCGRHERRALSLLAVDDELPALDDLARMLRALDRGRPTWTPRRAARMRSAKLARARATTACSWTCACPASTAWSSPASCAGSRDPPARGVRQRLRERRRRGVRAARARLPGEAGEPRSGSRRRISRVSRRGRLAGARRRAPRRVAAAATPGVIPVAHLRGAGHAAPAALGSILYVKAQGDYVRIYTDEAAATCCAPALTDLSARWSAHGFVRVHRQLRRQPAPCGRDPAQAERHRRSRVRGRQRGTGRPPQPARPAAPAAPVSRARRGRARPRDELADATAHGGIYLRRLRARPARALAAGARRLRRPARVAAAACSCSSAGSQHIDAARHPPRRLLVAVPPFPLFVVIGWIYRRRADALDDAFRDLVRDE